MLAVTVHEKKATTMPKTVIFKDFSLNILYVKFIKYNRYTNKSNRRAFKLYFTAQTFNTNINTKISYLQKYFTNLLLFSEISNL